MTFAYVGTYTEADRGGRGAGIGVFEVDSASGALRAIQMFGGIANPHFLALHPNGQFLYSTNGGESSAVTGYAIDRHAGTLTQASRQLSPGPGPTHLGVDPTGRCIVVANYAGGSVALYPISSDGSLLPHSEFVLHSGPLGTNLNRQDKPHAHMAGIHSSGRYVLICDLGLDRTFVYELDAERGSLQLVDQPGGRSHPGAGPRHLTFHPNGRVVYVINELDATVTVFDFEVGTGTLTSRQTVPGLPGGFSGENIAAEVVVTSDGRFLYASNRGHDSLAMFSIDPSSGDLTAIGHVSTGGRTPRHFDIEPSGAILYAANQDSDSIVAFRINHSDGSLTSIGHVANIGTPSCIVFRAS